MNIAIRLIAVIAFVACPVAGQTHETNYDETKIPRYTLPDPLTMADGTKVRTPEQWRLKRRGEILDLFKKHVYGAMPPAMPIARIERDRLIDNALGGKARLLQETLYFHQDKSGPKIDVCIFLPPSNGKTKAYPAFLALNFFGNHTINPDPHIRRYTGQARLKFDRGGRASKWDIEAIVKRGYALVTACYNQFDFDNRVQGPRFDDGVHLLYPDYQNRSDNWASIGAWAWGMSRILDSLQTLEYVDARRVVAMGHSRLGKTALWAGANDERFAMVISNDSGCGGAALARRRIGETVWRINTSFPHWFCKKHKTYNDHENAMPVDQHMLIALIAPRPVYVASALDDKWADPRGEFLSCVGADAVYKLLNTSGLASHAWPKVEHPLVGRISYHVRRGGHDVTKYDWAQYLDCADRYLKKNAVDEHHSPQHPGQSGSSVKPARQRVGAIQARPPGRSAIRGGLHLSLDNQSSIQQDGAVADGFTWFPPGVRGKAMGFDGIRTVVKVPADKIPDLSGGFTISAWVALQAYPWTMMAVVDQESQQQAGYYLGIHAAGYPGLWMAGGNTWQVCRSPTKLPLYEWNHLAGVWSPTDGMRLYVNGREVAAVKTSGRFAPAAGRDVWIGRNPTPRILYEAIRHPAPTPCSLQGLVDEVRIEPGPLSAAAIASRYQAERPTGARPLNPTRLPAGPDGPGDFGAVYTRLRYTRAWEHQWRVGEHPDVLVRFDRAPYRFVFWRGTSFIPCWVTGNGIWYTNEFFETGENPRRTSAEPMADKHTRNSQVRIIENNAARVVVHWRYCPVYPDGSRAHVDPQTGWGDWVDEFYTLYPDGVGVRKIRVFSTHPFPVPGKEPGRGGFREYHESIIINSPGTAPHDNIQTDALTLANMDGQTVTYSWADGPPKIDIRHNNKLTFPDYLRKERPSYPWRAYLTDITEPNIHLVHLKATYSPFVIVKPGGVMVDGYVREVKKERSVFPWWNHWPVTQIASNGRWAYATDRPSHSSLSHIYWPPYQQDDQSVTKIMLHGMTDGSATDLIPLANSWIHPAPLKVLQGDVTEPDYDPAERAYELAMRKPGSQNVLRLRLDSSDTHPAVNPAFVVAGWGERPVTVSLNGRPAEQGKEFRAGFKNTVAGTDLVLWVDRQATKPLAIVVEAVTR